MLQQLDVISTSGATSGTLTCHLDQRAVLDLIQVQDIQGLDPVKATINMTDYADIDGGYFTGASVSERNIVITFGYNPDWDANTIESLRQTLYQYFMPKQNVRLTITSTHLPQVQIDGIIESMAPDIFAQDPAVAVSIICPDPDFVGVDEVTLDLLAVAILGEPSVDTVGYIGSVEAPFHLVLTKGSGPDFSGNIGIQSQYGGLTVLADVDASNTVVFDSTDGSRVIDQITSGVTASLMRLVYSGAVWLKLQPGSNEFCVVTFAGGEAVVVTYYPRFGGL